MNQRLTLIAVAALWWPAIALPVDQVESQFRVGIGYRTDQLNWSAAGDPSGANPNIRSSVSWDDVDTRTVEIRGTLIFNDKIVLRGSYSPGSSDGGSAAASDFAGDNQTGQFSRVVGDAGESDVTDVSVGIGYQFTFAEGRTKLVPMIGYAFNRQTLNIENGAQVFGGGGLLTGPQPATVPLQAKYDAEWRGPWVGVQLTHAATDKLTLYGNLERHKVDFNADMNLNQRVDLSHPRSLEHFAKASGMVIDVGGNYTLLDNISINAGVQRQSWNSDKGKEVTYRAGVPNAVAQLNEVEWDATTWYLGVEFVNK